MMPVPYYALHVPAMVKTPAKEITATRSLDLEHFTTHCRETGQLIHTLRTMVNHLFPLSGGRAGQDRLDWDQEAERLMKENGYDPVQQEQLCADLRHGRIGLARNRLPIDAEITDVEDGDVYIAENGISETAVQAGRHSIEAGEVAVISLAAGMGSRWTSGAGVVKAANPFVNMAGCHRSFMEIHLAKSRRVMNQFRTVVPHIFTTSYLTHEPIQKHLDRNDGYTYKGPLHLSPGRSIGHRLIPMVRDLMFLWEEMPQETLDENKTESP